MNWAEQAQQNILKSEIKQFFADEVLINGTIKEKTRNSKKMKEAFVKFNFIDMDGLKPITKIVVSHSTAEGIFTALKGTLEQLEKELSRKPSKKEKKTEAKKEEKKEEKNEEKEERSYVI